MDRSLLLRTTSWKTGCGTFNGTWLPSAPGGTWLRGSDCRRPAAAGEASLRAPGRGASGGGGAAGGGRGAAGAGQGAAGGGRDAAGGAAGGAGEGGEPN